MNLRCLRLGGPCQQRGGLRMQAPRSHPEIKLIASDVDGTLLNTMQRLSPGVEEAVKQAAAAGVPLIVATGKARGPWVEDVFPRLGMRMPGVFMQGLLIYDSDGNMLFERELDKAVALDVIRLAEEKGATLIAYSGRRILAADTNRHTDRLAFYREPEVEVVGPLAGALETTSIQKLMFMADQADIDRLRPETLQLVAGRASLTTAVEGTLEVLPLGASKGAGLAWLLQRLGVDPGHVLAIGDGENDIEMLQLVGLGVAMGNAGPAVKAVAAAVVSSNDEDGVAEAIRRFVIR